MALMIYMVGITRVAGPALAAMPGDGGEHGSDG
jgi:hypothetical protein